MYKTKRQKHCITIVNKNQYFVKGKINLLHNFPKKQHNNYEVIFLDFRTDMAVERRDIYKKAKK